MEGGTEGINMCCLGFFLLQRDWWKINLVLLGVWVGGGCFLFFFFLVFFWGNAEFIQIWSWAVHVMGIAMACSQGWSRHPSALTWSRAEVDINTPLQQDANIFLLDCLLFAFVKLVEQREQFEEERSRPSACLVCSWSLIYRRLVLED